MLNNSTISETNRAINPRNRLSDLDLARLRAIPMLEVVDKLGIRRRGRQAFCPFHENTRTPAAYAYSDRLVCFGCGVSCDAIGLYRRVLGLQFRDAAAALAADFGVPLDGKPESDAARRKRERQRAEAEAVAQRRDDALRALRRDLGVLDKDMRAVEAAWRRSDGARRIEVEEIGWILQGAITRRERQIAMIERAGPGQLLQAHRRLAERRVAA